MGNCRGERAICSRGWLAARPLIHLPQAIIEPLFFWIKMPQTAFISKLYQMLNDSDECTPKNYDVVSWGLTNDSVLIKDQWTFGSQVLPHYFKHGNVSSFIRQLNMYGFRKRSKTMEFASPLFKKVSIVRCVGLKCFSPRTRYPSEQLRAFLLNEFDQDY
jgi:hypothetical protein